MYVKQISVFIENSPGKLADFTRLLGDNNIDLVSLSIADTTNFGILRLIVNQPAKAEQVLRAAGLTVTLTNVIAVSVADKPGGFAQAMASLARADISVEYMYAFLTPQTKERACIIMRVEDNDKTLKLLQDSGVDILDEQQVYSM